VSPKSEDCPHAKTRPLYADVWQNPTLIRGPLWPKITYGVGSLLKTAGQVRITGKIRMSRRIIRAFGVTV
jgi:hypothetical protein